MKTACFFIVSATALFGTVSTLWAQPSTPLTARELFYTGPPKTTPASKPPTPPPPTVSKAKPTKAPATTVAAETPKSKPPSTLPDGGRLTTAQNSPLHPLGLRYSILKYAGDANDIEVDPDLVFHSGDRIRLRVQVNADAFLYVVMQGSSGAWRVLFPSAELGSGSNFVQPGSTYDLPGNTRLVFDEQPGAEKLFLVLSRTPLKQLDQLIYELETRPASAPAAKPESKTLLASAAISDPIVRNVRDGVRARDLVFEKVTDAKPAPAQAGRATETAVYVVNASHAAESRLVADITLQHR